MLKLEYETKLGAPSLFYSKYFHITRQNEGQVT